MPTVITDQTDLQGIETILKEFAAEDEPTIYSAEMSPLERAIVMKSIVISNVVIQKANNLILFVLNNGAVLQKPIDQIEGLSNANEKTLNNFENMGNGVLWADVPTADISLKKLVQEELLHKYNLEIA